MEPIYLFCELPRCWSTGQQSHPKFLLDLFIYILLWLGVCPPDWSFSASSVFILKLTICFRSFQNSHLRLKVFAILVVTFKMTLNLILKFYFFLSVLLNKLYERRWWNCFPVFYGIWEVRDKAPIWAPIILVGLNLDYSSRVTGVSEDSGHPASMSAWSQARYSLTSSKKHFGSEGTWLMLYRYNKGLSWSSHWIETAEPNVLAILTCINYWETKTTVAVWIRNATAVWGHRKLYGTRGRDRGEDWLLK